MRKIVLIAATAMCLGAVTISAPDKAEARFGAIAIAEVPAGTSSAQPARYYYRGYRAYRRYPGYYGAYGSAYAYQPSPYYNYWYNAPARIYSGSREALDTCSLC